MKEVILTILLTWVPTIVNGEVINCPDEHKCVVMDDTYTGDIYGVTLYEKRGWWRPVHWVYQPTMEVCTATEEELTCEKISMTS